MASEVAVRYAEGLFALARENGTVKDKKDQCDILLKLYDANPELTGFFRSTKSFFSSSVIFVARKKPVSSGFAS